MVFKFITGHKVVARVAELPAWVFFPDVERVEWVNRFAANHLHYFTIHIWTLIIFYWNTEMLENLVLFYKGWWLSSGLLWQSSSSTSLLLRFLHLCYNMILILNCISWTFQWWSDLNDNVLPIVVYHVKQCNEKRTSWTVFIPGWASDPRQLVGEKSWPFQTDPSQQTYNFNSTHILSQSLPAHLTRRQTLLFEGEAWPDPTSAWWGQVLWKVKTAILRVKIENGISLRQTARDEIILDLDVTWAGESNIQVWILTC